MMIETNRLLIRNIMAEDEAAFAKMAEDGSLNDVGFDKDCSSWMGNWISETQELAVRDNPCSEYLAYTVMLKGENTVVGSVGCSYYEDLRKTGVTYFTGTKYRNMGYATEALEPYIKYFFDHYDVSLLIATVREENVPSRKVIERAGFKLTEKKMYQDLNDEKAKLYCFYEMSKYMRSV